jgi:hypothetical protein
MGLCQKWVAWLGLAAGVMGSAFSTALARAQGTGPTAHDPCFGFTLRTGLFSHRSPAQQEAAAQVPLSELPPNLRNTVHQVLDKPTLFTRGPTESFACCPSLYQWFLEHPDQAVRTWRRLGAKCMDIQNRGQGIFGWTDGEGSDVRWWTIHRTANLRVWFAQGNVKATGILPLVPVRAVVVLHTAEGRLSEGKAVMQHQADLFLHTDSKTAAMVARLMGPSAPRMAEQSAGQMEMFFSALAWYLDQNPTRAETVLQGILPANSPEWREVRKRAEAARSAKNVKETPAVSSGT